MTIFLSPVVTTKIVATDLIYSSGYLDETIIMVVIWNPWHGGMCLYFHYGPWLDRENFYGVVNTHLGRFQFNLVHFWGSSENYILLYLLPVKLHSCSEESHLNFCVSTFPLNYTCYSCTFIHMDSANKFRDDALRFSLSWIKKDMYYFRVIEDKCFPSSSL